jgi:hypothetical protein
MRYLVSFGRFWYDFIVGDEWRIAAGVVAILGLTAVIEEAGVTAWWFLVLAVSALLFYAVKRSAK